MHKPTTWCKSRIPRTKENSQRFYHTFSIPYNAHIFGMEGSNQKISRISLKIIIQCCACLNNHKMCQVVGLCNYYSHIYMMIPGLSYMYVLPLSRVLLEYYKNSGIQKGNMDYRRVKIGITRHVMICISPSSLGY